MLLALRGLTWGNPVQVDWGIIAERAAAVPPSIMTAISAAAGLRTDSPSPEEYLASTKVIYASASVRLEILSGVAGLARTPPEFRASPAVVEAILSERLAGTRPVQASANLPLERRGSIQSSFRAVTEIRSAPIAAEAFPSERTAGTEPVRASESLTIDHLISVQAASRLAIERRLSVSADWIVRLDWLASYVYPRVAAVGVSPIQRIEVVAALDRLAAVNPIVRIQEVPIMAVPTPVRLEPLRAGTTDTRGLNLASALASDGDTIASITAIAIARRDNRPVGTGDLSVSPAGFAAPWIASGTTVNWWQSAGAAIAAGAPVDYVISVSFLTAQGRPLIYDAYQLVTPALG